MSLTRLATRIAAARAIRNATLAGARVFDSAVAPPQAKAEEEQKPLIVVTTDDDVAEITGRDLFAGEENCILVIECAATAEVESDGFEIPPTDKGHEIVLDLLEHQVQAALVRETSEWSEVWKRLVLTVHRKVSSRKASPEYGVRFAVRRPALSRDLVQTPVDGAPVGADTARGAFLTAAGNDPQLATIAEMLRAEIEQGPLADWRRAGKRSTRRPGPTGKIDIVSDHDHITSDLEGVSEADSA